MVTYYVNPQLMTPPPETESDGETDWKPPRVQVDILDAEGGLVQQLEPEQGDRAGGIQRVVWDLRHPLAYRVDPEASVSFYRRAPKGPFVLPGRYQVRLTVGDVETLQSVEVRGDPIITISPEERRLWHDTLLALNRMQAASRAVVDTMESIEKEIEAARQALSHTPEAGASLEAEIRALEQELSTIREAMKGKSERSVAELPGRPPTADLIDQLYRATEAATALPTEDQKRLTREAHQELSEQVDELNRILGESLPELQHKLDAVGIRWTPGRPVPKPPELPL
jgi:hypothetical protein